MGDLIGVWTREIPSHDNLAHKRYPIILFDAMYYLHEGFYNMAKLVTSDSWEEDELSKHKENQEFGSPHCTVDYSKSTRLHLVWKCMDKMHAHNSYSSLESGLAQV